MGDGVSFLSGVVLLVASAAVIRAYWPTVGRERSPLLVWAIIIGFAAHGGNTLYWQVFGQMAAAFGWVSVSAMRGLGDWMDLLFKGGGAVAGWLHLKALHDVLPDDEKDRSVVSMIWYPHRQSCVERVISRRQKP